MGAGMKRPESYEWMESLENVCDRLQNIKAIVAFEGDVQLKFENMDSNVAHVISVAYVGAYRTVFATEDFEKDRVIKIAYREGDTHTKIVFDCSWESIMENVATSEELTPINEIPDGMIELLKTMVKDIKYVEYEDE